MIINKIKNIINSLKNVQKQNEIPKLIMLSKFFTVIASARITMIFRKAIFSFSGLVGKFLSFCFVVTISPNGFSFEDDPIKKVRLKETISLRIV